MALDYSLTLPLWLVTKDSMIIELVYVNLTVVRSIFWGRVGGGGWRTSRGWALILGWAFNRINTVLTFGLRKSIKFVYVLTMIMAIFQR